jgi:transposase
VPAAAGLLKPLPVATHLLADTAYDADRFRAFLTERGSTPVIPPIPTRTNVPPFDYCVTSIAM